jgi:hypothetical protein
MWGMYYLDSKVGYLWCANGCSVLTLDMVTLVGYKAIANEIRDFEERASMGMEKITDPELVKEYKYLMDDDNWEAKPEDPDFIPWPK